MMPPDIHASPPGDYLALAWKEFFVERSRGVSLAAHFPWIEDEGVFFVVQRDGNVAIGGLVLRPTRSRDGQYRGGLIGLVCVEPNQRGRGVARALIDAAITGARAQDFDDLLLWTGKPGVYEQMGFRIHDEARTGLVYGTDNSAPALTTIVEDAHYKAAIPPYASGVRRFTDGEAAIVIVDDQVLADWSGPDEAVTQLITALLPRKWQLHALAGDSLPGHLAATGRRVDLSSPGLQMLLPLRQRGGPRDPYLLRLLERI